MLGKKYSGKIGPKQSVYDELIWPQGRAEGSCCWCFENTVAILKHWEIHQPSGYGGSVWANRLGRPHIYTSFALNRGNSWETKGSLSWNKRFNSISWHKQQFPSGAPPLKTKNKAGRINSALGQTLKEAIILFITFSILKLILLWAQISAVFLHVPHCALPLVTGSGLAFNLDSSFLPVSSCNSDCCRSLTVAHFFPKPFNWQQNTA